MNKTTPMLIHSHPTTKHSKQHQKTKQTGEGGYRVPCMVRWPGKFPKGVVLNGIVSHADWFVTLLAAAGDADIKDRLKAGCELNGNRYKVHLDGHNQLDYFMGKADKSPRDHFFYVSDDGDLTALRYDNWKIVFLEQRCAGTLRVWGERQRERERERHEIPRPPKQLHWILQGSFFSSSSRSFSCTHTHHHEQQQQQV